MTQPVESNIILLRTGDVPVRAKERIVISREYLKSLLSYDAGTGEFRWRVSGTGRRMDQAAGRLEMGHRVIRIDGADHTAARLAWIYIHGEIPPGASRMRFNDGNPLNCRIGNIRLEGAHIEAPLASSFVDTADDRRRALTQDELKAVLTYNPDTGDFFWREWKHGRVMDQPAGSPWSNGCRIIHINGIGYMAQRLAWLYVHGEFPSGTSKVKPIDGNPLNCAVANLRLARTKRENDKLHNERHPDAGRQSRLQRYQGMSLDLFHSMLVEQRGVCAACAQPETVMGRNKLIRPLCVDHDHSTNLVRGLLCSACNTALGYAKDDSARLRALADYIDRHATNVIPLRSA